VQLFRAGDNPYLATRQWFDDCTESIGINMPLVHTPCCCRDSSGQIRCEVWIQILAPGQAIHCIPSDRLACNRKCLIGNGNRKIESIEGLAIIKARCLDEFGHSSQCMAHIWVALNRYGKICNTFRLLESSWVQLTITHRVW